MAPDLLDIKDCEIYFGEQGKGKTLLTKLGTLENIELEHDSSYSDIDILSLPSEKTFSFSFKFNKKSWYRVQKALGLIKPVYKKMRKGKRYVWYEVI